MAPLARVVHALPCRKRIRIPEKRGDEAYFATVKEGLANCPGVLEVEINPATAGVLVHHAADAGHFLRSAAEQELFRLTEDSFPARISADPPVPANAGTADKSPPALRINLSLRRLIFLGLIGTGITQAIEGNIAVPAVAAFWYALSALPWISEKESRLDTERFPP